MNIRAEERYSKRERTLLRQLAEQAWDTELNVELTRLREEFSTWESGRLSPRELADRIHQFHEHTARDLWKRYRLWDPATAVAYGIVHGVVDRSSLSRELLEKLAREIELFERESPDSQVNG